METDEKFIELRVAYPGSLVNVLGIALPNGTLSRAMSREPRQYKRVPGVGEQTVYSLPDMDMTYEVEEFIDGKLPRWYAATLEGDPTIYRISQYGAKVYARREMPLRDVVRDHPEIPPLTDCKDEDD